MMHFKSIRLKFIVSITLFALTIVFLIQIANLFLIQRSFSKLVPATMETSLLNAHEQIQTKLKENFSALETISNMPFIKDTSLSLEERAAGLSSFVKANEDKGYQACAITDTAGRAVLSSGAKLDVSTDSYYQEAAQEKKVVSDPFISRATGNLLIVYAVPYYDINGNFAGVITLDTDALYLSRNFSVQSLGENIEVFAITQDGTTVVSTDLDMVQSQLNDFNEVKNDSSLEGLVESEKKMVQGLSGKGEHVYHKTRELIHYMPVKGTSWSVAVTQPKNEAYQTVNAIKLNGLSVLGVIIVLSIIAGTFMSKSISRPIVQLADAANNLARGDVDVNILIKEQDETGILADAFHKMIQNVREQADAINRIAQGDYTISLPIRGDKDIVNQEINHMVKNYNQLMGELRTVAEQVSCGASQVAGGAQLLASGSSQQSASMENLSITINEINKQADSNTKLAADAMNDVNNAGRLVKESTMSMQDTAEAMTDIEAGSKQIAKVIKVIDDIAFQTNILALNAAVEAARAGQQGKGFAVVADEVRSLAGKSAEAAQETAQLIENSIQRVSRGVEVARRAAEEIETAGAITEGEGVIMQKISTASEQQSLAITNINQSILEITEVVQTNSATAQESAASAEELSAQSSMLHNIVGRFKLLDSEPSSYENDLQTCKEDEDKTSPLGKY